MSILKYNNNKKKMNKDITLSVLLHQSKNQWEKKCSQQLKKNTTPDECYMKKQKNKKENIKG